MKFLELRAKATRALGGVFDLRDFGGAVLETGSVPLSAQRRQQAPVLDETAAAFNS